MSSNPQEEYGGKVEEQIGMARRALNYPGRFAPPQPSPGTGPGTTAGDDDRWANVDRASGGGK
jgi:hypothetical protein